MSNILNLNQTGRDRIEILGRAMPKGSLVPVPLLCTLTFGTPLRLEAGESRQDFLERVRQALLELCPPPG